MAKKKQPRGHPAKFWEAAGEGDRTVKCLACFRSCVIPEGGRGFCRCRQNTEGALYSLNYGFTNSVNLDPVEKKPLYHFRPGTLTLSIGAPGCNLTCQGCQNYHLSQVNASWPGVKEPPKIIETLSQAAAEYGADSWSFTYSEPTVFLEYAFDLAEAAWAKGLDSIWVTNGSMAPEVLKALPPAVAALNIDLKGFTKEFYKKITGGSLKAVLDNIELALSMGLWVEVTTLLIHNLNDSNSELTELASFLAGLSPDLPWHVSRFFPRYHQLDLPPTPTEDLLRARRIGLERGLRYIYLGNAAGRDFTETVCPFCRTVLVERDGYKINTDKISLTGLCPQCGARIPGRWQKPPINP